MRKHSTADAIGKRHHVQPANIRNNMIIYTYSICEQPVRLSAGMCKAIAAAAEKLGDVFCTARRSQPRSPMNPVKNF
jgi:hypothetical protein